MTEHKVTTVVMPDARELMRRLQLVNDSAHEIEKFYPLIIDALAGEEKSGAGVVHSLTVAIGVYTERMAGRDQMRQLLLLERLRYLAGILTGEQEVILADALSALETSLRMRLPNLPGI